MATWKLFQIYTRSVIEPLGAPTFPSSGNSNAGGQNAHPGVNKATLDKQKKKKVSDEEILAKLSKLYYC